MISGRSRPLISNARSVSLSDVLSAWAPAISHKLAETVGTNRVISTVLANLVGLLGVIDHRGAAQEEDGAHPQQNLQLPTISISGAKGWMDGRKERDPPLQ